MFIKRWLALALATGVALSGCANGNGPYAPNNAATPGINGKEQESMKSEAKYTAEDVDPRIVEAQTKFAFDFYRRLSDQDGGNRFVSPLSLALALSMTMNGADGDTQRAMRETLGVDALTEEELNRGLEALVDVLTNGTQGIELSIANSLWADEGLTFEDDFMNANRTHYAAEVASVDLQSTDAVNRINEWVREQTREKIEKLLDEPLAENAILVLLNAIYLDANWHYPFDEKLTANRPFSPEDGEAVDVPMMQRGGSFAYLDGDGFQAVRLPYQGRDASMLVFLPDEGVSLADWTASLTPKSWTSHLASFGAANGSVRLPKFTMAYEAALKDLLADLGMGIAFDWNEADFSRMIQLDQNVFLSSVKQKAYLDVSEQGTVAAAVTSIEAGATSAPSVTFDFEANRPFFFAIVDERTGTILFMGSYTLPSP